MRLIFAAQAWDDYLFWQRTDPKIVRRIHELIKDATRHPRGLASPNRCAMPWRGIGPGGLPTNTVWFTKLPERTCSLPSFGIITDEVESQRDRKDGGTRR